MTPASRWVVALSSLLLAAAARSGDELPHQLLDRMNEAVRALDYEGRFVVQSGDQLDAVYIVHRVSEGSEKERVVSLTGKPREIIRSDEAVACVVPERRGNINVGRRAHGRSFSPLRGVSSAQLEKSYQMQMLEPERVAGRDAHQILIQARDDLRFGYRLFVDQASALPLRSVMFDESERVVSQTMFVDLRIGETVTPIEHDLSALQVARADPPEKQSPERLTPPAWVFSDLPPGFQLNVHRRRATGKDAAEFEHFIFSDGLATVSVYVQPAHDDGGLSGVSRLGPAMAVGRSIGEHEVVAIGEVPLKTLNWFVQRIQASTP